MDNIIVGSDVYWIQKTKTREIERVGRVIGVVQPECSPNKIIPNFVRETVSLRNFTTYLVRVYGSNAIFWQGNVTILPESKRYLIDNPTPVTTSRTFIDGNDRLQIKKLCKKLSVEFTESKDYLHIPAWGKRLVFRTLNGVEFICRIEPIQMM